ncbi:hypothetical protein [Rugamonas apoptosis]|uniref:Uncharacterized protein n=1 Tax=Rugamonas apoptosis TaxID=2758570 RepID=A0A7W2IKR9_9BURK|nr:hypothetical protein [Rugamonas apoptosis]MBA5687677.1 hypothetical protein [Rugamonas apoptosis]
MKTIRIFAFMAGLALVGADSAAEDYLHYCPLKKGDPISTVKEFYQIGAEPKALNNKGAAGTPSYAYEFKEYGVVIFLNENWRVLHLSFKRPFAGKIEGIKVGDFAPGLIQMKGQPFKKVQGMLDQEQREAWFKRKREIIEQLPNPAPREQVMKAFAAVEQVNSQPLLFSSGWLYKNADGAVVRYDVGATEEMVQEILSEKGTGPRPSYEVAVSTLTEATVNDFFRRADQTYTTGAADAYMAQFADSYTIKINGRLLIDGKKTRWSEVQRNTWPELPHLLETIVHSVALAADGQSAVAKVTMTERYRKQVGAIKNISTTLRPVLHNFAVVDEATVHLVLDRGVIKITRTEVERRDSSENQGK